ncbi:MAG: hypothetical protein ACJAS4_002365 [Bacteriovoracaceae bacterium]|jgi:hypothetical protein
MNSTKPVINREKHQNLMEGSGSHSTNELVQNNPLKKPIWLTGGLILVVCGVFLLRIWLKRVAKQKKKKISVHPEIL